MLSILLAQYIQSFTQIQIETTHVSGGPVELVLRGLIERCVHDYLQENLHKKGDHDHLDALFDCSTQACALYWLFQCLLWMRKRLYYKTPANDQHMDCNSIMNQKTSFLNSKEHFGTSLDVTAHPTYSTYPYLRVFHMHSQNFMIYRRNKNYDFSIKVTRWS